MQTSNVNNQIGRYRVESEVGGGGMGDVFEVWDPVTKRRIALKRLKFSYPRALHYFKREFRTISSFSHSNLVSLFDLHVDDDQYYYTMELIEGTDIYQYVNRNNRVITDADFLCDPDRINRLRSCLTQLFRGLAFLHRHNRIHRDIKPSNLLVTPGGQLKLVDFGIVKELLPGGQGQSLSQVFGTATYFSPEQSLGSHVTQASDNYSAGVVLYEMLCGVPPFTGESSGVALKHRNEPPPSISEKVPGAPADLVVLCMKLLQKSPELRPTADEALALIDEEPESPLPILGEFIGRLEQRKALHEKLESVQGARGELMMISGEGGMGKSCLIDEFARECNVRGVDFFSGLCAVRDHVPLRGLDTIVERIAEAYRKETARALRRLGDNERASLLNHFSFLKELLPIEEHGDGSHRDSVGVALRRLLGVFSRRRPMVLCLDQIELADQLLLETFEELIATDELPNTLFVFTVNPRLILSDDPISAFVDSIRANERTTNLVLPPFTLEETIQFIEEHTYPALRYLAPYVWEETQGIPCYVRQMVELLNAHRGGTLPRLQEILTAQFAHLAPASMRALNTVSCCPRNLSLPVMQLASKLDNDELFQAIEDLRALGIIELITHPNGDNRIVARQPHAVNLFRMQMPTEIRRDQHHLIAVAFESTRGHIEDIEEHWVQAGRPLKTIDYAKRESERAERDGLHERSASLLRVSLRHVSDPTTKLDLLQKLSDAATRIGRYDDALLALRQMIETEPTFETKLAAKCCQLALLAGNLEDFFRHRSEVHGPPAYTIAQLLVPYYPENALSLLVNEMGFDARLVRNTLRLEALDERELRECEEFLVEHQELLESKHLELRIELVILKAKLRTCQGQFDAALTLFESLSEDVLDSLVEPHRFKPSVLFEKAISLYHGGYYLKARTLLRRVYRYAIRFRRRGLEILSGIYCALVELHCTGHQDASVIAELEKSWQLSRPGLVDAQLALITLWQDYHSSELDALMEKHAEITSKIHFQNSLEYRSVHRHYWELMARINIWELLTNGSPCSLHTTEELTRNLLRHPGRPSQLSGVIRLATSFATNDWHDLSQQFAATAKRRVDPLVEALMLGIRAAGHERNGQPGIRSWQSAMLVLDRAGLALPPEIKHFRQNFLKTTHA